MANSSNDNKCLYVVLAVLAYFLIVRPALTEKFGNQTNLGNCYKMDKTICSPDCCGKQWPVSFDMKKDPRINDDELGTKYMPTNLTCTGKRGRGCVCADKRQYQFLKNRGNNA